MNPGAKRVFCLPITLMILCVMVSSSYAGEVSIFGPKKYIRTRGAPDVYTETIAVPYPDYVNTGKIVVLNGIQIGQRRLEDAIDSAEIFLNGEPIFVPRDFKQTVYYLEAPINLGGNDCLLIELRSRPGSYLTIQIIQDLDPPIVSISADPDAIKVNEGSTLTWGSILADVCSIEPGIGSVDPSGALTVSPDETTTYIITARGPGGVSTASTTVSHISSAPVAHDQFVTTDEDMEVPVALTAMDLDKEPLVYQVMTPPAHGALLGDAPNLTYAPHENYNGPDAFTFKANDGQQDSNIATVSLTILAVNDPPVLNLQSVITDEDIAVSITLSGSDVDGNSLTYRVITGPASGALSGTPPNLTYASNLNFYGTDSLTFVTNDGTVDSEPATVEITVNPVNDIPEAMDDIATTDYETPIILTLGSLLSNDTDLDGDMLTISSFTQAANGKVTDNGDSTLTYIPNLGFSGTDIFTYVASDGNGGEDISTVMVTVNEPIAPSSDLEPTSVDVSGVTINPQTLMIAGSVDVLILNNGMADVIDSYELTLFEDSDHDQLFSAGVDNVLGHSPISNGPAAQSFTTATVDINGTVQFAHNLIYAIVDPDNQIAETNEDNNITHNMVACEYIPPVGTFDPVLEWKWTGSTINPSHNQVMCLPVVASLNDDNGDGVVDQKDIPDIIFNTFADASYTSSGTLRAISGDGSGELFSVTSHYTIPGSNPAVGDIDGDGLVEILVIGHGHKVLAFENDGSFKWTSASIDIPTPHIASITLSDIDEDGAAEVIVGRSVLNADGSTKWVGSLGYGQGTSCVANLDLQGHPEVISGNTAYRSNGDTYWQNLAVGDGFTAVGNFNDDPHPEIVVVSAGYVYLLEYSGEIIWGPIGPFPGYGGPPTIANMDNDSTLEIGVAFASLYVVFEFDGSVKWTSPTQDVSSGITGSSVFDFEGDGSAEVVYADEYYLRIYRGADGLVLFETLLGSGTLLELPVIADVDNDGNGEIVAVSNNYAWGNNTGIVVYGDANDTWVNTRKIWNQHAYSITNINDDGTIPQYVANNWEIYNDFRCNQSPNALGCVDLTASYIRMNQDDFPDSVVIIARIGNGGALHVSPGLDVSFYDDDPEAGGTWLGRVQIANRLESGTYEDVSFQWDNPSLGLHTIYVRADDDGTGKGNVSETDEENNTMSSVYNLGSHEPVANAGLDRTVFVDNPVQLNGTGSSDPDGDAITYQWIITDMPPGSMAALNDPALPTPSFTPDTMGTYVIQLVVNDGVLDSGVDFVTVFASPVMSVPDVVGMTHADAETTLTGAGLVLGAMTFENSDTVPAGQVMSQKPAAGTSVFINTAVDMVVSRGERMVIVPDVTNMAQPDAEAAILAAELGVGTITLAYSLTVPEGTIIAQNPAAGNIVERNTNVDLVVSLSVQMVSVPNVVGLSQPGAEFDIQAAGLMVGSVTQEYSDSIPVGEVTSQNPASGTSVPADSAVDLIVSLGIRMVEVPDVTGMAQADAETAILGADLTMGSVTGEYIDIAPQDRVISQNPAPGSTVIHDTSIDLRVSLGVWTGMDEDPPNATITADPGQVNLHETVRIRVVAWDNVGVVGRVLTVNGTVLPLIGNEAFYTAESQGFITAQVTVTDAARLSATASTTFAVVDPNDVTPPTVSITFPAMDSEITSPVDIIGTAKDVGLAFYTLEYTSVGESRHTTLVTGSSSADNDVLGTFDPTLLENGIYRIRLSAVDMNNNLSFDEVRCQVTGNLKVGLFTISFTDLNVPLSGVPIQVIRTYDTRTKARSGDFGYGWNLSVKTHPKGQKNQPEGEGWEETSTGGGFPTYCLEGFEDHFVSFTLPDGRTLEFDFTPNPSCQLFVPINYTSAAYTARYGTPATLEPLGETNLFLYMGGLYTPDMQMYDPQEFRLTLLDGTTYVINLNEGVKEVLDTNGNTLTITENGIIHSSGKSISFTRDGQGRITEITDPNGNRIEYEYDTSGDLIRVTDQESNETQFTYNSVHGLIDIIDPRGVTPSRNVYDPSGRLIVHIDAFGNRINYNHDIEGRQEVVADRLENVTAFIYDNEGNILSKTDALGNTSTYSYDDRDNKLSETDPLGNTTLYTYDANNKMLTETDPLGNTTTYTYNAMGLVLTKTNPEGFTTTNIYDAKGNLLTNTDPNGNTITNTYYSNGKLQATQDCLGHVTSYTYDSYGNMTTKTDALGNITSYTYDNNANMLTESTTRTNALGNPVLMTTTYEYNALGQLTRMTGPYGNFTVTEYNAIGKESAKIDKTANRTEYAYDVQGNMTQAIYSDGTTETYTYDAEGNRLSSRDRAGRTTTYEYDALSRLVLTTYPDGAFTTMEYDAGGRLAATIDENGNRTEFRYDGSGSRILVVDALLNETCFTYDKNGNQLTLTDANNHTTTYEYDGLSRRIKTIFPNASFATVSYDAMGRRASETDPAGNISRFEYDALGRLERVIDALGGETTYGYDEVGNKISQTDPNGHTTLWAYDSLGRVVAHTLPLGMSEAFTYDGNGNLLTRTDFNGDTTIYTYDACCGRLLTKTYPDATQVSYTYTPTGRQETVTDERGVTTYGYDLRDRLLSVKNPDGSTLTYTYDGRGNRTSVTAASGSVSYTYDALNRLKTVTDPDGGITTYTYDNVGSRKTVTYPNGTVAECTYDTLNRLTYLENRTSTGTIISGYSYTLGPSGNRTRVIENTGRILDYAYDAVHRLVRETVTDAAFGNEAIDYTYDASGNRLRKTDSSGTVIYSYDANDRLMTETGPDYAYTYTYDNNGNTLSQSDGSHITHYFYDHENRLIAVDNGTNLLTYAYDVDGIRVSSTLNGLVTSYLVDKNRDYAQVLEERDGAGAPVVEYVYGNDLISQKRGGASSYYHYDGQMSTRALTNSTESVTDTYTYDAFGSLTDQAGVTENLYLYTGEQYDPNAGFYYLRARYYNQDVGRFVNTDPCGGNTFEPVTLHKYLYAANDPIGNLDPSGYTIMSMTEAVTVMSISYALNSIIMPNLAKLRTYVGRTDRFEMQLGYGGSIGNIFYLGVITGYIWELNPSSGEVIYPRKRGVFNVTLIGFGAGIGFNFPSNPIRFPTATKRDLEHFDGVGRISSAGASLQQMGVSCIEMQMAEGTAIPIGIPSIGPSVSAGNFGAFVASVYWDLIYIDRI